MPHNICLIDDQIPLDPKEIIDDTKRYNSSNLRLLLNENINWDEPPVKKLLANLLADDNLWNVSAFKNPAFYIKCMEQENYKADIIIFDWDYGKGELSSEEFLKRIVESNFSIITIFTASDKKEDVEQIIENDFKDYKNRIDLIIKSEQDSVNKLVNKAKHLYENNFAFKYSRELRNHTLSSLESILVELGKPEIKDVVLMFGESINGECFLNTNDLTEIIIEKIRNVLVSKKFGEAIPSVNQGQANDLDNKLTTQLWSYRLYYSPNDNIIRQGDIIHKKDSDLNTRYIVLSSDCHLKSFWKKNAGYITIAPIHKVSKNNKKLIEKLNMIVPEKNRKNIYPTSLVNTRSLDGPTIIPFIPVNNSFENYIVFPKGIFSVSLSLPEGVKSETQLTFEHMPEWDQNRKSISEPFKTPLIEHILYNITSYGAPDYPKSLNNELKENLMSIFE